MLLVTAGVGLVQETPRLAEMSRDQTLEILRLGEGLLHLNVEGGVELVDGTAVVGRTAVGGVDVDILYFAEVLEHEFLLLLGELLGGLLGILRLVELVGQET